MKLATTTTDFVAYADSQQKSLELLRQAGFRYADYNFGIDYARKNGVYQQDYLVYLDDVRRTADCMGIQLVQAHSPLGRPIAPNNRQFLWDTARCVEACGIMGISNLVVHSGYDVNLTVEETFEKNKQFFLPLLELGDRYHVNILVENFNKMEIENIWWIDNALDLLAMVKYVDHPRFHAVWDAGHGNMQEMSQDEALRILGKHVYALHIQDNLGDADSHLMPFYGSLNFDSLMHGLIDIGYDGYFTFESSSMLNRNKKRFYSDDTRLKSPSLDVKMAEERLLYEIGKNVLTAYDCFEEV